MSRIIRMQIVRCNFPCRNLSFRHCLIHRSFHADTRNPVVTSNYFVLILCIRTGLIKYVMYQKHCRIGFRRVDFSHKSLVGFTIKQAVVVIDTEFHNDKIRCIRKHILLHSCHAELRRCPADAGIDIHKLRLRILLLPPFGCHCRITSIRCRG